MSLPIEHADVWTDICRPAQRSHNEWVVMLKANGVKLAHPDDGWVNRSENYIDPSYPSFDLNPQSGDLIALGTYEKYRLVRVTEIGLWGMGQYKRYHFVDFDISHLPKRNYT